MEPLQRMADGAASPVPPVPSKWRLWVALWLLGLPGIVALVWALVPTLAAHRAVLPLPLWAMVLLSGLQPSVLLGLSVWAGVALAHRVGLAAPAVRAWLQGQSVGPALRPQWLPGLLGGVAGGLWLWALSFVAPAPLRAAGVQSEMGLAVKLLYGGVTEELLMRWGVMSLLLWLGWRVFQRGRGAPRAALVAAAVVLSALLFALGHLPAAQAAAGGVTPAVLAFVLVGNTTFGLVAGALFARYGLEAAILAHLLTHALSHPLL